MTSCSLNNKFVRIRKEKREEYVNVNETRREKYKRDRRRRAFSFLQEEKRKREVRFFDKEESFVLFVYPVVRYKIHVAVVSTKQMKVQRKYSILVAVELYSAPSKKRKTDCLMFGKQ